MHVGLTVLFVLFQFFTDSFYIYEPVVVCWPNCMPAVLTILGINFKLICSFEFTLVNVYLLFFLTVEVFFTAIWLDNGNYELIWLLWNFIDQLFCPRKFFDFLLLKIFAYFWVFRLIRKVFLYLLLELIYGYFLKFCKVNEKYFFYLFRSFGMLFLMLAIVRLVNMIL